MFEFAKLPDNSISFFNSLCKKNSDTKIEKSKVKKKKKRKKKKKKKKKRNIYVYLRYVYWFLLLKAYKTN